MGPFCKRAFIILYKSRGAGALAGARGRQRGVAGLALGDAGDLDLLRAQKQQEVGVHRGWRGGKVAEHPFALCI